MAFCCSVLLLHQLPRSYSALFANRGRPICSETVADLLRDGVRPAPRSLLTWSEIRSLDRRIPALTSLCGELSAWETARNNGQKGVDWQFTTETARVKLKRLYPQFKS